MAQVSAELRKTVEQWIVGYENGDMDIIREVTSTDSEAFFYGTGADEKIYRLDGMLEQLKRDWAQSTHRKLKLTEITGQIIADGAAWVACEMVPTITLAAAKHKPAQEVVLPPLRTTMVLVRTQGAWQMIHSHSSWPYPEQSIGQSFPNP